MSKLTQQMIDNAKQMMANLEVAKTMDRKTQTRRIIATKSVEHFKNLVENGKRNFIKAHAKYQIDDILWVREPARVVTLDDERMVMRYKYLADDSCVTMNIPERFINDESYHPLPKWIENCQGIPNGCIKEMARIFLKVTDVRVERLQDITYQDIYSEGVDVVTESMINEAEKTDAKKDIFGWIIKKNRESWINLWNSTAPKGYRWEDNPYVFCYTFEVVKNG